MPYEKTYTARWADMDPNLHMRHTAYMDYATQARLEYLAEQGFSMGDFARLGLGAILFREDTRYLKEVNMNETIRVTVELGGISADGARWRIIHTLYKADGREAAIIAVDGAWLDLRLRKLTLPPAELAAAFATISRHASYAAIEREK